MTDSNVVFNFGDQDSDKEDVISKNNNTANIEVNKRTDNLSDLESVRNHIDKIDMYDRLNFKRLATNRSSRKVKTQLASTKKFSIEKFTEEITKIEEEITLPSQCKDFLTPQIRDKDRKRTIRFNNKRTTYQYPKERQLILDHHILFDKDTEHTSEKDELELEASLSETKIDGNMNTIIEDK